MMLTYKTKTGLLVLITSIGIISVFFIPPIHQNTNYHHFADSREIYGIPNFYNVLSNLLFLISGATGVIFTTKQLFQKKQQTMMLSSLFFFIGIFFTGIGSSYYHLHPETETLVWDRLPMTITFMAFFSVIISEYMDPVIGKRLLFHLLFLGIVSVLYWYKTELNDKGDLRFYVLIQFLPLVLIPLILVLFTPKHDNTFFYWAIMAVYILAKVFESADQKVFSTTHYISGHSLKHLMASLAPLIYLWKLVKEKKGFNRIQ